MNYVKTLSILASSNKPLTIAEIINLLEISRFNFKNQLALKKSLYNVLRRLTKRGFVVREVDASLPWHPYRFRISDTGLSFLAEVDDLEIVREIFKFLT